MQIIKRSNLDLGELVVARNFRGKQSSTLSIGDRAALAIATCGIGYIPIVPATFGSALGVCIYLIIGLVEAQFLIPTAGVHLAVMLIVVAAVSAAGIWASTRTERVLGEKDPRPVIVDEIAGQLLTFLLVPFATSLLAILAGFVLFRIFDILKPYPAHRLESLKSGVGIMADDLMAGLYGALALLLLTSVFS